MSNDPFLLLSLDSMELVDFPTTLTLNIVNGDACCHLTHLHLEDNKIVTLPPAIGQLHDLVELNVEGNLLTTLPRDMQNLNKLQRLHAANNKVGMCGSLPDPRRLTAFRVIHCGARYCTVRVFILYTT